MSRMDSGLLRRALDVYSRGGVLHLIDKFSRYSYGIINEWLHESLAQAKEESLIDNICYQVSVGRLKELKEREETLSDILDTAYYYRGMGRYRKIAPLQIRDEFREMLELVDHENPEVVLEIGTAKGGTFYGWGRYIDTLSMLISVDLPGGGFGGGYSRRQSEFFSEFAEDCRTEFFRADSQDPETISNIKNLIGDEEIDILFIDGDHTYEGVMNDFQNYAPLVADNGLIIFHDIVPHPDDPFCEVDKFWDEIKDDFQTEEIIASKNPRWGGIGVLYK